METAENERGKVQYAIESVNGRLCEKKTPQQKKGVVESANWNRHQSNAPPAGRVVIYWSCKDSALPIRDVTDSQKRGHTLEPNVETRTYNLHASCNQDRVLQACFCGERYLFFATRYHGQIAKLRGNLIFTGYYTIDETFLVDDRVAIRSRTPFFISPNAPLFATDVWRELYTDAAPSNLRHLRVVFTEAETSHVLRMFHARQNSFPAYVAEVNRLKKRVLRSAR